MVQGRFAAAMLAPETGMVRRGGAGTRGGIIFSAVTPPSFWPAGHRRRLLDRGASCGTVIQVPPEPVQDQLCPDDPVAR
jgi:hypothetical protein